MAVKIYAVCHAYFRKLQAGERTLEPVEGSSVPCIPEKYRPGVKELARLAVINGELKEDLTPFTKDDYERLIGEPYPEEATEA